jgi:hypothetical protein
MASVNIFSDIYSVLINHWQLISGIVLMMFLSQILLGSVLRMAFREALHAEEYFALSTAGWILPLSLVSVLWLAWGTVLPAEAGDFLLLIVITILAIVLFLRARKEHLLESKAVLWMLIALFGAFIFLRLAFVSKVIVPLYFDSAQHYLIINSLIRSINSNELPLWSTLTGSYYHMGFHLLTAFMVSALRADIIDAILILGQMIVAALPFSIFPVIKQETQSNAAGIFAALLAAFGWYMPAYAVNWGKYPALTSLPMIVFVISLAYLTLQYKDVLSRRASLGLSVLLLFGIFITVFVHSRALVVFGIFALAWFIVTGWQRLSKLWRVTTFFVILIGIVLMILFIRTKDVFGLLFDPYWEKGLFITAGVLFLAVFAQWRYPRFAFASILVILLFLGSLLVPVQVPGYGTLTLLDRPFVEMILYLPLSFLGGAGLAGLEKSLRELTAGRPAKRFWSVPYISVLFIGLLLVNALANYNIYPAECCDIVGRDDLVAIDWVDKNLPSDAIILISSTELRVLDTNSPQGAAGGDAGAWITPLTGRMTIPFPYQSDFSQQAIFDTLCQLGAQYIFVGETGAVFNNGQLSSQPDRYNILLSMPETKLYQLSGCPPLQ